MDGKERKIILKQNTIKQTKKPKQTIKSENQNQAKQTTTNKKTQKKTTLPFNVIHFN